MSDPAQSQSHNQTYQDTTTTTTTKPLPLPPTALHDANHSLAPTTYALFRPETPPSHDQALDGSSREQHPHAQGRDAHKTRIHHHQMPTQNLGTHAVQAIDRHHGSSVQPSRSEFSSNHVNAKEALAPITGVTSNDDANDSVITDPNEVNAKEALAPIACVPLDDGARTSTFKDQANAMMSATAEKANAILASTTEGAGVMAGNAADQAQHFAMNAVASANLIAHNAADKVEAAAYDAGQTAKVKFLANPTVQDTTEQLRETFSADSHEMARKDYGIHGAVQRHQGVPINGVRDIGWHRPVIEIPDPLIGGLPNGRLFSLIRRFNKDVFDVRAVPLEIARGLDLNESWSDKHASDKITLNLQRVYLSIILGLASLGKQVARLRSWKETRRTGAFCTVYFISWYLDILIPLVFGLLATLVSSKEARDYLFPPAPLALVNVATGGIQKPQAGQLGTSNTLTGAPEKQEGEAKEEEAANFADNIRHLVGKAVGMHGGEETEGDPLENKLPKPMRDVAKAVHSAGSAPGHSAEENDLTQSPMEEIIWAKVNPRSIEKIIKLIPHVVGEVVDNWERFENAISPTYPFNKLTYLRIDALLGPVFLASIFINYYMVYKGIGLAIGFAIFGDPILTPGLKWLNRNYPSWPQLLEPKNNILRGVPTNNQLTLTLLRIGEANQTPIPPVPSSEPDDLNQKQIINVDDIQLDATDAEIHHAVEPSGNMEKRHPQEEQDPQKHKRLSKIMRMLKGNTKAAVETKLAVDHVRAKMGSEKAKGHLGVLPKKKNLVHAGPSEYKSRYEGKRGWIYITENSVLFSEKDKSNPVVEIPFVDIKALKRATAFSMKTAEIAADWGTEQELLGSVEIDGLNDKTWRFTALPERDELFNRLVAIGSQRWENV